MWDLEGYIAMKRLKYRKVVASIAVMVFIAIVSHSQYARWHENRRFSEYEVIVTAVRNGSLRANSQGEIRLPAHWAWATSNGYVYQLSISGEPLLLFFPTKGEYYEVFGETTRKYSASGYIYGQNPPESHLYRNI